MVVLRRWQIISSLFTLSGLRKVYDDPYGEIGSTFSKMPKELTISSLLHPNPKAVAEIARQATVTYCSLSYLPQVIETKLCITKT